MTLWAGSPCRWVGEFVVFESASDKLASDVPRILIRLNRAMGHVVCRIRTKLI